MNRLTTAKDHSSMQIDIGRVNELGVLAGGTDTVALCAFVRRTGLADEAFCSRHGERLQSTRIEQ